jgi:arylsulfatase A
MLLASTLTLLAACQGTPLQPVQALPNIVLVYADDMGWGDLGVQNLESKIPTPNLDRLASEGMRFTDAHSSSAICTPSRFALLTGMHHWRRFHGIVNSFGKSVFEAEDVTMPEMLKQRGYATACIGKWHLGWDWDSLKREGAQPIKGKGYGPGDFDWSRTIPDGPLAHGFDHYFGDDVPNFPPYTWIEDDIVLVPPTLPLRVDPKPTEGSAESRPGPMAEGWRQDLVMPRLTARAVAWLREEERSTQPFFLYFPWTSPHAPITPAGEFRGSTQAGGYGDFLHQSDAHLGEILRVLEERDLAKNTIVIFTSDNGPENYAYARTRDVDHRSAGPLRGLKRDIYEGGHRVPFLVRWPGVVKSGSISNALIGQVDLMRTLSKIVQAELPDSAAKDSVDQLAVWKGSKDAARTFHVHNTFKDRWAIRMDSWLLVDSDTGAHTRIPKWYTKAEGLVTNEHPAMLFDLTEDLGQRRNIYASQPEVVRRLREMLAKERSR